MIHVRNADQEETRIIGPLEWLSSMFNVYTLHLTNTLIIKLSMFEQLQSLETLEIDGCYGFFGDSSDLVWMERLQNLSVRNCREMGGLLECLLVLPSLEELCVEECPDVEALPANGLPATLKRLAISCCGPRLVERCLDHELDGAKIAGIDVVYLDGQCVQTNVK
ncbi:hypothetical protein ACP4OV_016424 [Aristida adscensionis]